MTSSRNTVFSNIENFDTFALRRKRHHKRSNQINKCVKNINLVEKSKLENVLMVYFLLINKNLLFL